MFGGFSIYRIILSELFPNINTLLLLLFLSDQHAIASVSDCGLTFYSIQMRIVTLRIGASFFAAPESGQLLPGQQHHIPLAARTLFVMKWHRQCIRSLTTTGSAMMHYCSPGLDLRPQMFCLVMIKIGHVLKEHAGWGLTDNKVGCEVMCVSQLLVGPAAV